MRQKDRITEEKNIRYIQGDGEGVGQKNVLSGIYSETGIQEKYWRENKYI